MRLAMYASVPTSVVAIPLRRRDRSIRAFAFVDEADAAGLAKHTWFFCRGYALRNMTRAGGRKPQTMSMHRQILSPPEHLEVDHINGWRLDNRRLNLRAVTHSQNGQNRSCGWGQSGLRGVSFDKWSRKWRANVRLDGQLHYLGEYATPELAADVAVAFRREHMPYATN